MFRCDNCGSGYSVRMASTWDSCPRCLARDKIEAPLSFELGWRGKDRSDSGTGAQLRGAELRGAPGAAEESARATATP
jgi:hypothetical protein